MKVKQYKVVKSFQDSKCWYVPKRRIYILWFIPIWHSFTMFVYSTPTMAENVIREHAKANEYVNIKIN